MKRLLIVASLLMLAGCAQLMGLANYTLTQAELQDKLRGQLDDWSQELGQSLGVRTQIDQLDLRLHDQKARLKLGGEAALSQMFKAIPLALQLEVEGRPSLEGKAVYLRDIKLLTAKADLLGYSGRLGPDTSTMGQWLTRYLNSHPVYRIPDDSPLAALPLSMEVAEGRLVFRPSKP